MFAALVIHHAKRMRRIVLSLVGCLVLQYFSTFYLINGTIFGWGWVSGGVIEHKMWVLIFSATHYLNPKPVYYPQDNDSRNLGRQFTRATKFRKLALDVCESSSDN